MGNTFGDLAAKMDVLANGLSGPALRQVMTKVGVEAQKQAERAASSDLGGDPKFSGWAPILETKVVHIGEGRILIQPTRDSAGPWTVAQTGRNQGNASGFAGPGINKRTGVTARTKAGNLRKTRATRARRWNGTTEGKGTADTARAAIARETPDIFEGAVYTAVRKAGL